MGEDSKISPVAFGTKKLLIGFHSAIGECRIIDGMGVFIVILQETD